MGNHYYKKECWVCGEEISTAGWAFGNHLKMHVRKGELIQKEKNPANQKWGYRNHTTKPVNKEN